jgi:catechol-2,3-dioxygenase
MASTSPTKPSKGVGISHLVLNVRDIDAAERFYTEVLGFEQCGDLEGRPGMTMRFYRGADDHHHDLALVQVMGADTAPPGKWSMAPRSIGINHIALRYPDREAWLAQINHMKAMDVEFLVRGNHGMTHSVYVADPDGNGIEVLYDLPDEVWQGDVNGALNYFEILPNDGPETFEDDTDYKRFSPATG